VAARLAGDHDSFSWWTTVSSPGPGAAAGVLAATLIVAHTAQSWSPDPTAIWREPCHLWCSVGSMRGALSGARTMLVVACAEQGVAAPCKVVKGDSCAVARRS
jgi:hypothetical protein